MGRLWLRAIEIGHDAVVVLGALPIQGAWETHRKWFLVELTRAAYLSRMAILGPPTAEQSEDRFLQCEEALEAEFQALVWKAIKAGWDEGEACAAIASLADHHILSLGCNEMADAMMRKLRG